MNKREKRVINAFINCVEKGEFSFEYATTLLEDNNKYGYLNEEAKEVFYSHFETPEDTSNEAVEGEEVPEPII